MDRLAYIKYSNERAAGFNICTEIREDVEGKKYVLKRPYTQIAAKHVELIYVWYQKLSEVYQGSIIKLNHCEKDGTQVRFEYLEGRTFEEEIDVLLEKEDYASLIDKIGQYFKVIKERNSYQFFVETDEFRKVFGDVQVPKGLKCGNVTNIDMIFSNIIIHNGCNVVDYEWTFDFPIPVNFVLYRALFFYLRRDKSEKLRELNLYQIFNISLEEQEAYEEMEQNFGKYVIKDVVPLRDIDLLINNKKLSFDFLLNTVEKQALKEKAQVYLDLGEGFSEESSYFIDPIIAEDGTRSIEASIPQTARAMRIDPVAEPCLIRFRTDFEHATNGSMIDQGLFAYYTDDPQILFGGFSGMNDTLRLEYSVYLTTEDLMKAFAQSIQHKDKQREKIEGQHSSEIARLQSEIVHLHAEHMLLQDENTLLHDEISLLNDEMDVLSQTIHERNENLRVAQMDYDHLMNSRSIRITKPMRAVGDGLRKVEPARLAFKGLKSLKNEGLAMTLPKVKESVGKAKFKKSYPYAFERLKALKHFDQIYKNMSNKRTGNVKFSILVPLYNTPEEFLREMIESVLVQTYANWELCLCDGSDFDHMEVRRSCKEYAQKDARIKYRRLRKNRGISGNTNACIKMASGNYMALLDHDDFLHPDALYAMVKEIKASRADFLYTDEATFQGELNNILTAHFKPDFAPDNLRANNYICHFSVFSRTLLDEAGWFHTAYDGSQDHDLMLRLSEKAKCIRHISGVYYFWRHHPGSVAQDIGSKTYAIEAGKRAVRDSLVRQGLEGVVESSWVFPTIYRIQYKIKGNPSISILIPSKNHVDDIRKCIGSILEKTSYSNYEILILDNGSEEEAVLDYYNEISVIENITVKFWNHPFNYSEINNFGASQVNGDYLVLLNNDTEVITEDWLQEMLMFAQRDDVGAVGAKLLYPDRTIQHAGIVIGLGPHRIAGHIHYEAKNETSGYMGRLHYAQDISAVTAACLMVKKERYVHAGGFDETFKIAFNDVDFCLKLRQAGYLNIFTPFAELYHYESRSRGYDPEVAKYNESKPHEYQENQKEQEFQKEVKAFKEKWRTVIEAGDPYFNKVFNLDSPYFEWQWEI